MKYDVAIVGAGSMGMAAGYFLAKKGQKVILLDAGDPPHHNASHHGETRIIRHAYGEGEAYVPLALRAQALWQQLEQESNQSLFLNTGVLNMGERESPFIQTLIASAVKYQLPLDILDASQVSERFPSITLPDNYIGCFESTSGVLRCEACIRAYRTLAIGHGAKLLTYHGVDSIDIHESGVTLTSGETVIYADRLIVSAGAWSAEILRQLNLTLPMQPTRKTFAWFEAEETKYGQDHFPAFSFDSPEGIYYGFPSIDQAGLKVGRHDGGQAQDPNLDIEPYDSVHDSHDLERFLAAVMPDVGNLMYGKTCMYSMTEDENFIIDRHPQHSHVLIAAGFSGHGFKFASVIGEMLSELASNGQTQYDISMFSLERFSA